MSTVPHPKRIILLGATGTIGRATLRELTARGHEVVCFTRAPIGAPHRLVDVSNPASIADGFKGAPFAAVLSCMASRTGVAKDAWAIDHQAHLNVLRAAQASGVTQFVLLSALCVQNPKLAFQHAKLAFEQALQTAGLTYAIVRPTAFFKSLSGQIQRVRQGKTFLTFGDGTLTACKPISDADLAAFLADCLDNPERANRILPIGGPGPAITPRQQGEFLFNELGLPPRFKQIPPGFLSTIAAALSLPGAFIPKLAEKAELARIGHYYATESMLVLNPETGRYDAADTPSTGTETLFDYYRTVLAGGAAAERGAHKVF